MNNRGSEWRKWDLHFHTPSSYDYKDKGITNQQIIDKLYENKISVVAITDHHIIDIERIRELQQLGSEKGITVLPGIEFCSELGGSEAIHFIGIFAENSDIETIWTKIQGKHDLTKGDIESKGNERIVCKFEDTCKTIIELGGIVSVHAGTKTNSIESIKSNLLVKQETKTNLLSDYIDILEIGKIENQDDYKQIVFPAIGFELPIIICSDNHDIKNYTLKENCWIKTDPTFEGLKQIIYEPTERVRIQENKPEQKPSYQIIDRIEISHKDFIDKEKQDNGEEKHISKTIYLNPNLNTIVGGRSTGKSILLGTIAKKLNSNKDVKLDNKEYSNYIDEIQQYTKIFWKDDTENNTRDIEYFPQSYMYQLAKNTTDLDKLVENIITQDANRKTKIDVYRSFSADNNSKIVQDINELFYTKSSISDIQKQITETGDEQGIIKEKQKLAIELENLKTKIQITDEEWSNYSNLKEKFDTNITLIQELEKQKSNLYILKSISFINDISNNIINLDDELKKRIEDIFRDLKQKYLADWNNLIETILLEIESKMIELKKQNENIEKNDLYLKGKSVIDCNLQYKEIENRHKKEIDNLRKIEELKRQKLEYDKLYNSLKTSIIEKSEKYYAELQGIQNDLSVSSGKLKITAGINPDFSKYKNILYNSINQQGYQGQSIINKEIKTVIELFEDISELFEKLLSNSITLKGGYDNKKLITELLGTNFFNLSYEIEYDGDKFKPMSEGKKAFVILMLLLDFSNKQCPILIDQPEDDLDNRAIYNELVTYIKNKKKERQIIIVTHNSNIVISADSELVIVSNQQGINSPNKNDKKFDYVFGSIESSKEKDLNIKETLNSQGIRQHICEILEGGEQAFKNREKKYGFN
ncbi:hypothetical protein CAPN001_15100 [Capnocytophaga stomatis]|nr:hypothetical protein [Capnocytophaga stomatis]GIJ96941.1 hypothetical protein CAPN001_15100 [Capnocytophaga stomatis]